MRTLRERARDWRWWGEGFAHHLLGALIAAAIAGLGWLATKGRRRWVYWIAAAIVVGCLSGVARELVQNWGDTDGSLGDSIVDAITWASGAIVVGGIALGVRRWKGGQ